MMAIGVYAQSRTRALLRRTLDESSARVREAEASSREVRALNAELRRQVADRSRELAQALSRIAAAPAVSTRLGPGDVVVERYRIIRPIGAGGMGQVHEVERLVDGRRLALKALTGAADPVALARFAQEAQVAAHIDHAGIVAALDVGVTPLGTMFAVMELVAGPSRSLRDLRPNLAEELLELVERCLLISPASRPSTRDLAVALTQLASDPERPSVSLS